MDYKNLFLTYDGRLNRMPFWLGGIIISLINLVTKLVMNVIFGKGLVGAILVLIVALILIFPGLFLAIKRYHDRDKSGWWCLIVFIPVIGIIWYIIELGFLRGTVGPNRFGPDPLP